MEEGLGTQPPCMQTVPDSIPHTCEGGLCILPALGITNLLQSTWQGGNADAELEPVGAGPRYPEDISEEQPDMMISAAQQ